MVDFIYWLRLPWPNTMLDGGDSAQISKNLGQFFHFLEFLALKHRNFCPMRRATWRLLLLGASKSQKISIFGFGMKNYTCLLMAKKFGQVLSPQKGKKHSKNDPTAPILTHKKQCWEK